MEQELREKLADMQHDIWAHWMRYMFSRGIHSSDGTWMMPSPLVERWRLQMNTPYSELTEREKDSDREQADKILGILGEG